MRGEIRWGVLLSGCFLLAWAPAARAATHVEFDTPATLACQEISDPEFLALHPDERLWEARFRISALVREGDPEALVQFLLTIQGPGTTLQVVDYLPKTTLQSNFAGNVSVHQQDERNKTLGLAVTGSFESLAKLTGNGAIGSKDKKDVRFELVPPRQLVASSGTIQRGGGAYFKLKPTRQSTLEGGKEFVIMFRAPFAWRAARVRVRCEAVAVARGVAPLLNERVTRQSEFAVTLYAGGDIEAKAAAKQLAAWERQLKREAQQNEKAIYKRAFPTPLHELGAMLDITDSRIPENWLQRLIARPTASRKVDLLRLPEDVRVAATRFIAAARRVEQLSGAATDG